MLGICKGLNSNCPSNCVHRRSHVIVTGCCHGYCSYASGHKAICRATRTKRNKDVVADVTCCARCHFDHKGVTFMPLNFHGEYTHWAPCPTNGQPILMTQEEA